MPRILPPLVPENTPATELIRVLYKQLCTRVVETGCEFKSFTKIVERTRTIHSCLNTRITNIVQGNQFECADLMAYTKAVGLLEQTLCDFFFASEEIISSTAMASSTTTMTTKWSEKKETIVECYKSLYREEFQKICSEEKDEETVSIEECFKEDDAYIYEFFRKRRTTTESTKIETEAYKTLSQVTENSEITKTYGKEVVEVKDTLASVKDIFQSTDTSLAIVKKKTENRQEYEAIKTIEQDITKLTGRLTYESTRTDISEERKTKLKEEHWKATKEVIDKFKECVTTGSISVEELTQQVEALTSTCEVGTFKATTRIEELFRLVFSVRRHFFSRSCHIAQIVCMLKECFAKEQNNNRKNCEKLEKCVETCIQAIECASQSASTFKEVISTSTYTQVESYYTECFEALKTCYSEFDTTVSWRKCQLDYKRAEEEDKKMVELFKGKSFTGMPSPF